MGAMKEMHVDMEHLVDDLRGMVDHLNAKYGDAYKPPFFYLLAIDRAHTAIMMRWSADKFCDAILYLRCSMQQWQGEQARYYKARIDSFLNAYTYKGTGVR